MDERRFDQLARQVAGGLSRRQVLTTAVAGALGGATGLLGLGEVAARRKCPSGGPRCRGINGGKVCCPKGTRCSKNNPVSSCCKKGKLLCSRRGKARCTRCRGGEGNCFCP